MRPLEGIRVVEVGGIGPTPFCAMLLADLGAEVTRIERPGAADLGIAVPERFAVLHRNRARVLPLDLKTPDGAEQVLALVAGVDVLIEGFRPGVMERLGLGPDTVAAVNPQLVYGRVTGWGREGPLAQAAGHDINYIALSGMLHAIGRSDRPPVPPLNLLGDFGGGALYLAFGIAAALVARQRTGRGQIVDAAMVDGAASLGAGLFGLLAAGLWADRRGENLLDSGAPWYDVYETADGRHVALGAIERRFYREFLRLTGLDGEDLPDQYDRAGWPVLRRRFETLFRTRGRDDWCALLEGTDACFSPVLSLAEAPNHPHNRARGNFVCRDGVVEPAPTPRYSDPSERR